MSKESPNRPSLKVKRHYKFSKKDLKEDTLVQLVTTKQVPEVIRYLPCKSNQNTPKVEQSIRKSDIFTSLTQQDRKEQNK